MYAAQSIIGIAGWRHHRGGIFSLRLQLMHTLVGIRLLAEIGPKPDVPGIDLKTESEPQAAFTFHLITSLSCISVIWGQVGEKLK